MNLNSPKTSIMLYYWSIGGNEYPSPALSILKSYLTKNGFPVNIKYNNLILQNLLKNSEFYSFIKHASIKSDFFEQETELISLIPFLFYLSLEYKDKKSYNNILLWLRMLYPDMIIKDNEFYHNTITTQLSNILEYLKIELAQKNNNDILLHGFSARFSQWVPALVSADIIKKNSSPQAIVIGGFDSEEEALSFMQMSDKFDFAIWGEGEIPLLKLCTDLKNKTNDFDNIPRLIYRKPEIVSSKVISSCKSNYIDISNISPDFNDYFECIEKYNIDKNSIFIPIENARGCAWNRCNFCFFNVDSNYRIKNNETIISEIIKYSKQFSCFNFIFVGTDLIGFKYKIFEDLLDKLKLLAEKEKHEFNFFSEVIPKNIPIEIIKKMALLNFTVQIGYESTSDSLLAKMNKCTRFSDLLLFIKIAHKYGIKIEGANIMVNTPEETDEDVLEAINNIPFLRFFLGELGVNHKRRSFNVKKGVKYYKNISENEKIYWNNNSLVSLLPDKIMKNIGDRFSFFSFYSSCNKNGKLWDTFFLINDFFKNNKHTYKVIIDDNNIISYREYCNDSLIKSITFDDPLYVDILKHVNNRIESVKSLYANLLLKYNGLTEDKIKECLKNLKNEFLLYYNENIERSIISIVDI